MTATTALANDGLFELTQGPSFTRADLMSFTETRYGHTSIMLMHILVLEKHNVCYSVSAAIRT